MLCADLAGALLPGLLGNGLFDAWCDDQCCAPTWSANHSATTSQRKLPPAGPRSSSGGGIRTHNPSVNSRMLCH
jgi:hypothetical protein